MVRLPGEVSLPRTDAWRANDVRVASRGVRHVPVDLQLDLLRNELTSGWALRPTSLDYVPEGGGSYHWRAVGAEGSNFVTVDDLDDKAWLGESRDEVFDGLSTALATAELLRRSGLGFVLAPMRTREGAVVRRLDSRYAVSVFPFIEGHTHPFGPYPATLRGAALDMVADLHRSTSVVRDRAARHVLSYGDARDLHALLMEPDRPWHGGPYSEPARRMLADHVSDIGELVSRFDLLSTETAAAREELVITHGEPHPANVIAAHGRLVLVDWDTTALAPPERDLSFVLNEPGRDGDHYQERTGHAVDFDVIAMYQLRWYLDDLASTARLFRRSHEENPDTHGWWQALAPRISLLPNWLSRVG
jgi:spectinomycin phosphotransferase